ncbi:CPBP family intramembrane glutamic endopeptidase [Citromicrobium bathyomarinum]|uniref:CPBP family intramembrane glutamic endopeptidase n=1 Tax=Citromicrobium bathyomarinum TaxID=72174 RepID=UPI003159B14E
MPGRATLLLLLTGQTLLFTAIGVGLWVVSGRPARSFVTFGADEFAAGASLAGVLVVLAAAVYYGLPKVSEYLVQAQAKNFAFLEKRLPLPAIVWVALGAGIGEEALFRGGVQTIAADYVGMPLAIAFAAALFAVVHFARPLIAAVIFAIGIVFGSVFWITGSLLTVMVAHALYDVFALWYVQKEMHRLGVFAGEEGISAETTSD